MLVRRICQHEQWLQDRHSAAQDFAIATCVFYHTQHLYCVPSNMQENIIKKKKKQASNQPTNKKNQHTKTLLFLSTACLFNEM